MTAGGSTRFWPLFDLTVRTPRLEVRLLREADLAAFVELIDAGIHDPGTMPFFFPWTDVEPQRRAREAAQWMWRHRANWSPDNWTFTGAAFIEGKPVGVQSVEAAHYRAVRSVETGSWLGLAFQGQGLGREMREAILHLAFAGLGAEEALSGAFEDNVASLATLAFGRVRGKWGGERAPSGRLGAHDSLPHRTGRLGSASPLRH